MQFLMNVAASLCLATSLACAADDTVASLAAQLQSGDVEEQVAAAQKLGELGLRASAAAPDLVKALESDDLGLQLEASLALGQVNTDADLAVPALTRLLNHSSPLLRHSAAESLRQYGSDARPALPQLIKLLKDKDDFVRMEAASTVVAISPEPMEKLTPAVTVLVSGLSHKNPVINQEAVQGLVALGASAVPVVQKQLGSSDPVAVIHACDVLMLLGGKAASASDALMKLADAKNVEIRWHALRTLGAIGAKPDRVVAVLTKHLKSDSPVIQRQAALALGKLGEAAASAVPALIVALKDDDETVRRAAAVGLGEIGPKAAFAVPALIAALDDASGAVTLDAVAALGRIGSAAVPALLEQLKRPEFQRLITAVLEEMGPDAAKAVPVLTNLISAEDSELRREAILALAAIGPDAIAAVPELINTVKDETSPVRPAAAYALGRIGASEGATVLQESLDAPENPLLRLASVWALLQLDPKNDDYIRIAVPRLAEALSSDRPRVRREAATTLGQIGERASPAVPALQQSLQDEDPEVRMESLVALAEIGPESASALDDIMALVHPGGDPTFRPVACYALGRIGKASKPAIPLLHRLVQSRDRVEKTVAAWALVKIEPNAEIIGIAIPLLATAVQEAVRPEMRVVAAETLGEIGAGSGAARDALVKAQKDSDESVRKAADAALKQLK